LIDAKDALLVLDFHRETHNWSCQGETPTPATMCYILFLVLKVCTFVCEYECNAKIVHNQEGCYWGRPIASTNRIHFYYWLWIDLVPMMSKMVHDQEGCYWGCPITSTNRIYFYYWLWIDRVPIISKTVHDQEGCYWGRPIAYTDKILFIIDYKLILC
jgi:hypothetical protein